MTVIVLEFAPLVAVIDPELGGAALDVSRDDGALMHPLIARAPHGPRRVHDVPFAVCHVDPLRPAALSMVRTRSPAHVVLGLATAGRGDAARLRLELSSEGLAVALSVGDDAAPLALVVREPFVFVDTPTVAALDGPGPAARVAVCAAGQRLEGRIPIGNPWGTA